MSLLAFDTATPATVVGLSLPDGRVLEARDDPSPGERPGHATRLLPLAAGLLAEAGIGWGDLVRVAVGVGPGTFTGLRVGLASAHGVAQARGIPLVGVSSLAALARGAGGGGERVLAAIDARRGEVFVAGYLQGMELLAPRPIAPAELPALLAGGESWVAVGDGVVLYRSAMIAAGALVPPDDSPLHRVRAASLCELGAVAIPTAEPVLPDYRRRPDAEKALAGVSS